MPQRKYDFKEAKSNQTCKQNLLNPWYKIGIFLEQDKEGGINPTFEPFCLRKICGKPAKTIAANFLSLLSPSARKILLKVLTSVAKRV